MWHRFTDTDLDDLECAADGCGLIVSPGALVALTLPCPARPCSSPVNAGQPCVMAEGEGRGRVPTCTYCGRCGGTSGAPEAFTVLA